MALKNYETVFILTPVLSEQQMKETVEKFRTFISEKGGEIYHEEDWGLRKLAYPIGNKSTGYYTLIEFKAEPDFILTLDVEYRRDEAVMRYLTTSLDKYAVKFNEDRRMGKFNKKSTETEEAAS